MRDFVIISAERKHATPRENLHAMAELGDLLLAEWPTRFAVHGCYNGVSEASYLVPLLYPRDRAEQLGALGQLRDEFEQESILYVDDKHNAELRTAHNGAVIDLGRWHEVSAELAKERDSYTLITSTYGTPPRGEMYYVCTTREECDHPYGRPCDFCGAEPREPDYESDLADSLAAQRHYRAARRSEYDPW